MSMSNFEVLEKLGEGSYSVVYKVLRKTDSHIYAAKKVKFNSLNSRDKQNALNEIRILASISHPNIVGYKEVFIDEPSSSLCLIMEYASKGDLLQQINSHKKNGTKFSEPEIWKFLVQAVKGLKALHNRNILHRDIKSANIFVTGENVVQLGDLNVAKVVNGLAHTQTGTPYYASPEVWKDSPYDSKSDIWSLGCVLYELCALEPAFKSKDMKELFAKVVKGKYTDIPPIYSEDLANVIKSMLQIKPVARPSCEKILDMPVVKRNISIEDDNDINSGLIQTIKLLPSLRALKNKLPGPMYQKPKRNLSAKSNKNDEDKENKEHISRKPSKIFTREPSNSSFTPSPYLRLPSRQKLEPTNIFKSKPLIELHPCNQSRLPRIPKSINNSYV
jgi:NIMA (never in mitosis gene a)-related kinase 1/4/5